MNKLRVLLAALFLTLGITTIGGAANAAPAHAYTSWYSESIRCDWIDTYYNVDYNWWEELWGNRDYRYYVGTRYQYNWACHMSW